MSERSNDLLETHGKDFKFKKDFGHGLVWTHTTAHKEKVRLKSVIKAVEGKPREADLDGPKRDAPQTRGPGHDLLRV